MKRKLLFILILFTLISKKSFSFYGNEISLFDKNGNAKAYIDNNTIFDWNGTPFAYIYIDNNNYHLYNYNGKHIGWYDNGILYDNNGYAILAEKKAIYFNTTIEPIKGIKKIEPIKGIRELAPIKPIFKMSWCGYNFENYSITNQNKLNSVSGAVNYISPISSEATENIVNAIKSRSEIYRINKEYRDDLLNWISELEKLTNDQIFIQNIHTYKNYLTNMKGKDYAIYGRDLEDVNEKINIEIEKCNNREDLNKVNNNNSNYEQTEITTEAKLREKPDPSSSLIRIISVGKIVTVMGYTQGYWKVLYDGFEGYLIEDLYFKTTQNLQRIKSLKK